MTATGHGTAARRTKIVATLGPATDTPEQIEAILHAGVNAIRLNFSHGTQEEHADRIRLVRGIAQKLDRPVAVIQDLQGPKIRIGRLADGSSVALAAGQELAITTEPVLGTAARISTTYPDLPRDVSPGDAIVLDDGRIRLRVMSVDGDEVRTQVEVGGLLGEHKGINLPGVRVSAPAFTDKDREDLAFGLSVGIDYVALSFVRHPDEVRMVRRWLSARGQNVPIIAKLERAEAIERLGSIINVSDGVMVARGDLGVEVGEANVPILQKRIIRAANQRGVVVITATQMLESMTVNPSPTRAEATDVANAVWDDTDALMLSGETAIGRYPTEAVATMAQIAAAAEAAEPSGGPRSLAYINNAHAISRAARGLAEDRAVAAIVAFTRTGRTAYLLSQDRPRAPILAFTPEEGVYQRLGLWWGVQPVKCSLAGSVEALIEQMEAEVERRGLVSRGDTVVIVGAMPVRRDVHTNFVKLHTLGSAG